MEEQSPRAQQSSRSQASSNWRVRDDTLRAEAQPRFQRRTQQNGDPASPSAPGTRLYVGNLLYSAQQTDVEQLFTENGFTVAQITMSIDPFTGRNPSYCFVDLDSAEEANRAMTELNGKDVLGRTVKINPGIAKKSAATGNGPQARVNSYERGWPRDQSAAGAGTSSPPPICLLPHPLTYKEMKTPSPRWSGVHGPTLRIPGRTRQNNGHACTLAGCRG